MSCLSPEPAVVWHGDGRSTESEATASCCPPRFSKLYSERQHEARKHQGSSFANKKTLLVKKMLLFACLSVTTVRVCHNNSQNVEIAAKSPMQQTAADNWHWFYEWYYWHSKVKGYDYFSMGLLKSLWKKKKRISLFEVQCDHLYFLRKIKENPKQQASH